MYIYIYYIIYLLHTNMAPDKRNPIQKPISFGVQLLATKVMLARNNQRSAKGKV